MAKVTIGIPVYNGADTIHRALDCLLAQNFSDFELIISDNASTDGTQEICESYAARDSRVRYIRHAENLGASMNFRFALFEAHTPYFMWAAADDLWAPSFIARHLEVLEADPGVVLSQSRVLFTRDGLPLNLSTGTYALTADHLSNVVTYLTNPADNSRYYGLFRTEALKRVFPLRSFFSLDWAVAVSTLRYGRHHEIADVLMIRDTTEAADYERGVARDHRLWLWRIFPMLHMTIWLLRKRMVPVNGAVLLRLAKLNLYMHLRFGMYRWNRAADLYLANNSVRQSLNALLAPGLRGRIRDSWKRAKQGVVAGIYAVWRALPITLRQRQALKRAVMRLVTARRPAVPAVRAEIAEPAAGEAAAVPVRQMPPLPSFGWRMPKPAAEGQARLAVVVVARDRILNTLALIDSLATAQGEGEQEVAMELVLADNGSADISGELFRTLPGIRYQRTEATVPFATAANAAIQATSAEVLVFPEQTLRVGQDYLRQCLMGTGHNSLIGPQLRNWDGFLDAAGGVASVNGGLRGYGAGQSGDEPAFLYARAVDYCPGAFSVRRNILIPLGGFSTDYTTFEISALDICTRLHAIGGEVNYWPAAIVSDWSGVRRQGDARIPLGDAVMAAEWARFLERNYDRLPVDNEANFTAGDRSRGMRLLIIDADTPQPDMSSGSVLALNLIRMLGDLGFRVTFVPESNMAYAGAYTQALQAMGVDVVYAPLCNSVDELLKRRGAEFDVVVLSRAYIAERYMDKTREFAPQAKIIFNTVDLHFVREIREAQLHNDPRMLAEARKTEVSELASIAKADATIVLSTYEDQLLRAKLPSARIFVVPLLFDIPERLERSSPDHRYDIMFVGTYQHPPNRDAAIYFAREIWPLVRPQLPEARFLVVGSSVTPDIRALAGNGVEVVGYVEDLDALLASCRLTVAPVRYGAGLKGKVASSLMVGVPVVATSLGVEGTPMTNGVDVMIADDPESFAEAVVRVYRDPDLWQQLATAGFAFVRREYAIDANVHRVRAVVEGAGVTIPPRFSRAAAGHASLPVAMATEGEVEHEPR
jgi:O-antigen biosynthesis protein